MNTPLTPKEKRQLSQIGITLKQLYRRYYDSKLRAKRRGKSILPQYAFYRKFIKLLIKIAEELNVTPIEAYSTIDVHSPKGDYVDFVLLTKETHHILHQHLLREKAKEVLHQGVMTCRHCNKVKPIMLFRVHKCSLLGHIKTCKDCYNARRRDIKKLKEVA